MDTDSISMCSSVFSHTPDLDAGTLDDILQNIIEQELNEETFERINTILLSFHLYSNVYCFLTAIDAKFWHLCSDPNLWPQEKFHLLKSLAKILDHWLSNPFAESFYNPPDFLDLKRLLYLVSQWLCVFAKNFQPPPRRKTSKTKESARCQLILKARDSLHSMTQSNQLCLAQIIEDICTKITTVSDHYHIKAGLFKEANCDKDIALPVSNSNLSVRIPIVNGVLNKLTPRHIAEQLTLYDAELFTKVLPSECLNHVRHLPAKSVDDTIKQFNRIYALVQTSIIEAEHVAPTSQSANEISNPSLASITLSMVAMPLQVDRYKHLHIERGGSHSVIARSAISLSSVHDFDSLLCGDVLLRAEILAKWIAIAAELRDLRSFSAFTSVMTALQGCAISGLYATWNIVERHYPEKNEMFHELSELLKLDDNRKYARELMDHMYSSYELARQQETKHSGLFSSIFRRKLSYENSTHEENILKSVGTIPYLGIFLNDLAMLNESAPDRVPKPKPPELRRPASGTGLVNMVTHSRKTSNGSYDSRTNGRQSGHTQSAKAERRQRPRRSQEVRIPTPLVTSEPKSSPRRKRMTESTDSGTGSGVNESGNRKPPVPIVVDHRSRKETATTNECDSYTTSPSSSGVSIPKDKRSRQAKGPNGLPLIVEPLSVTLSNFSSSPQSQKLPSPRRSRKSSLGISSMTSSTAPAATMILDDDDDLINIRKHIREYKILSKLMQLQATAARYKIQEDTAFREWFDGVVLLSENGANQKAKELEPMSRNFRLGGRHISGSLEVLSMSSGGDEFSRSRASSPTGEHRLPPCFSAIGSSVYDRRSFNSLEKRKPSLKESIRRHTFVLKCHSSSYNDFRRAAGSPSPSQTHQHLAAFKNKIKSTLHRPRSDSTHPSLMYFNHEEEVYTRF